MSPDNEEARADSESSVMTDLLPDAPLDPPDYDTCPVCKADLSDLDDDDAADHLIACDPASEKAEREFDERRDDEMERRVR
jgi:hypothetical protein